MSKPLYVARRAFKSRGVLYEVGQVIEDPSSITLLRSRIMDRDVLELLPGDVRNPAWLDYLKARTDKELDQRILEACGAKVIVPDPVIPAPTVKPVTPAKPATKTIQKPAAKVATATKVAPKK